MPVNFPYHWEHAVLHFVTGVSLSDKEKRYFYTPVLFLSRLSFNLSDDLIQYLDNVFSRKNTQCWHCTIVFL